MAIHRCHTTILFADLSSSTRIGESLDPELVAEVLGRLRKVAEAVISNHGGIVNQFYGDGVLAAFGFPNPQEDDVVQAISAALELHEAAKSILPLPGIELPGMDIQLHSGIHSGIVAVQEGDHIQGRYKLTGDALNTAARLSDSANPNELLVSAPTFEGVKPYFVSSGVKTLQLKGKEQPLQAYNVVKRSSVRTRYGASVRRGLSSFVGRKSELYTLQQDFNSIGDKGARYFEFCGDPGVGKTRLCEEFIASLDLADQQVYKAYCVDSEGDKPLHPFIQIMRSVFELEPGMPPEVASTRIRNLVQESQGALSASVDDYLRLLNLANSDSPKISSAELLQKSINASAELIHYLAQSSPVLLYLDDWHLADETSQKTLVSLLTQCSESPLFVLTATRTAMAELKYFSGRAIQLQPFDLSMSSKLIASFFGYRLDENITANLHNQSGGNALFIEELCLSLPGNKVVESIHHPSDVPNTLQGLISKRINQLPEDIKQLVKIAAILGNRFHLWLFKDMVGEEFTEQQLEALSKQDVLHTTSNKTGLRFKHGITREVCYEQISLRERQQLHQRACKILESKAKQGTEQYIELLAYHYAGTTNQLQAGLYAEMAGDKAKSTLALDRADEQYRRALKALDPTTCEGSDYAHWKRIILKYAWVSIYDPLPAQFEAFEQARSLAQTYNDQVGIAQSEYWMAYLCYTLGRPKPAIEHCQQAIQVAQQLGIDSLLVEVHTLLGQAYGSASQYDDALALLNQTSQQKNQYKQASKAKSNGPSISTAFSLACKGMVLGDQGNFDAGFECCEQAKQMLEGSNHQVEASILGMYSLVKLWHGNWEEGKQFADRAQEIAQSTSNSFIYSIYRAIVCYSSWRLSHDDRIVRTMISNARGWEMRGKMLYGSLNYGWLAEILANNGDRRQARKFAARGIMRARKGDQLGEAMAYRALAKLAQEQNARFEVERYMQLAEDCANRRQSRHERANNHLLLAKLASNNNQFDKMEYYLDQARRAYEDMGMSWHMEQAILLSSEHPMSA